MADQIHLVVATPCFGGGEIRADLESRLDHVGPLVFHGDVSSQFAAPVRAANAA